MEAVFSRLFEGFLQAASLAIALLSLSSAQAETLLARVSWEDETGPAATVSNQVPKDYSEAPDPFFCQDTGTLENWPAAPALRTDDNAQPCAFLKASVPLSTSLAKNIESGVVHVRNGSLTLEADAFLPIIEFATTDFPVGGDLTGVWKGLPGLSDAGVAKSQSTVPVAHVTRVPEPCIAILSGVGLAVALFGRKRGRRVYGR